ncbi:MAG: helix-turn-helix domain-containing protein [Pseudomonadota bacterium]
MSASNVLDLADFQRRCGQLSVRQACLPAGIDPIEQGELDRLVRRRRMLEAGQALYRAGDPMKALHVARRGTVKAVIPDAEGEATVVAFHLPGELIGLDGLGGGRHRCDALALEPAEVCELPYDALADAAARLPRLREQLHRVVGQGIARDMDHAALLMRRLAHERVAGFVDDLSRRYCALGAPSGGFRLPMTRDDIAGYLGLTLESVSRSLTRLQEDGVLYVRGRRIEILDPPRLAVVAGSGR